MTNVHNYWIEDNFGKRTTYYAKDETAARHYFMMEGDHVYNFGPIKETRIETKETMGWMTEADPYEGQAVHRTRSGKGAVGQAIAKHKRPPNCS